MQTRLMEREVVYSKGSYNESNQTEQWIRVTEGCPHNCPYCYEPQKIKIFDIPEIIRNKVRIMDMNLLCKPQSGDIIKELGKKRVDGKVVHYELVCGIDFRFLSQEIADLLSRNKFGRFNKNNEWSKGVRLAWDWWMSDQYKIKDTINRLVKARYPKENIMVFMICNWKIPYSECCKKLDLCKVWNVQVADCYYDNQTFPRVIPEHWTEGELKQFRKKVRKHNQLVNFKIDPEVKREGVEL